MDKGFLSSLFDLSFTSYITTSILKILYTIYLVVGAIAILVMLIGAVKGSASTFLIALVLSPIFYILYAVMVRIGLEVIAVIFRIEENTRKG